MRLARSLLLSAAIAAGAGAGVRGEGTPSEPPTRLPSLAVEERAPDADDPALRPFLLATIRDGAGPTLTLAEVLRTAPGLLVQESFGGFEPPRFSVRGSGLQSAPSSRGLTFLLNGFPLNLSDGSVNTALIAPELAGQLRVYRGAAPVGPASLGGTLELCTMPASEADGHAAIVGGSYGLARARLQGTDQVGDTSVQLGGDHVHQDGFRDRSAQERTAMLATVRRPVPLGSDTCFTLYHAHARYDVPGPLTFAAANRSPRSVTAEVLRDQPHRVSEVTQLSVTSRQENAERWTHFGAAWQHSNDLFQQLQTSGIAQSRSDDLTLRGELNHRLDVGAAPQLLQLHASAMRGWREVQRYANAGGARGDRFADDGLYSTTAQLHVADTLFITPRVEATAAVSVLHARREIEDRLRPAAGHGVLQSFTSVQPRLSVTWAATRAVQWHATVARAAEPPTFDDLLVVAGTGSNLTARRQRLAAQHATTWELGTAGSAGPLAWDLTAYHADWSNEILRLADDRGQPRGAVNAQSTRHQGVEAMATWALIDAPSRLELRLVANWSRFAFVDDPQLHDRRLAGTPPWQGFAELHYDDGSWFATAALDWAAGTTFADHAGRLGFGGRSLLHLHTGWRWNRSWSAFVGVRNAFDRKYIASPAGVLDVARDPATSAVFLPGVGRSFVAGLDWRWR